MLTYSTHFLSSYHLTISTQTLARTGIPISHRHLLKQCWSLQCSRILSSSYSIVSKCSCGGKTKDSDAAGAVGKKACSKQSVLLSNSMSIYTVDLNIWCILSTPQSLCRFMLVSCTVCSFQSCFRLLSSELSTCMWLRGLHWHITTRDLPCMMKSWTSKLSNF